MPNTGATLTEADQGEQQPLSATPLQPANSVQVDRQAPVPIDTEQISTHLPDVPLVETFLAWLKDEYSY